MVFWLELSSGDEGRDFLTQMHQELQSDKFPFYLGAMSMSFFVTFLDFFIFNQEPVVKRVVTSRVLEPRLCFFHTIDLQDSFITPRAVLSLALFNGFRVLAHKSENPEDLRLFVETMAFKQFDKKMTTQLFGEETSFVF